MTKDQYRSWALAVTGVVAVALWAGLPLVLVPFSVLSVLGVLYIANVVHSDTPRAAGVTGLLPLDGSHERIDPANRDTDLT